MCVDRAGIVGSDGETHQGLLDMAFFKLIPNITIMAPKDFRELKQMLEFAINLKKPVVIRYPRGGESEKKFTSHEEIILGKCEKIVELKQENEKNDKNIYEKRKRYVTMIAIGNMVAKAKEVAEKLKEKNIEVEVINSRFIKPLDEVEILKSLKKTSYCVTIEDGTMVGGLGSSIKEIIVDNNITNVKIKTFAYPDQFIEHGSVSELEKKYGMDVQSICSYIEGELEGNESLS